MAVPEMPAKSIPDQGRTLGTWSLLMLPMLIVSAIAGGLLGMWLLGRKGFDGSEPMSVQGPYGWFTFAIVTVIFMAPMVAGVILALKAYRAGARRLGLAGMLIDGVILVAYTSLSTISLATQ